jgi:hypothetical protein
MRTTIYVDGFNLYYRRLKRTRFRWVNLQKLFSSILPSQYKINQIHYFTAKVKRSAHNPGAQGRQKTYLLALNTLPNLEIHYGQFFTHIVDRPEAANPRNMVPIINSEEKGTDVNLSVHLLNDAWKDKFDCAVLVTNDSDMAEAMKLVKDEFPKKQLCLMSTAKKPTFMLKQYADFEHFISNTKLRSAQFPKAVKRKGKKPVYKPPGW